MTALTPQQMRELADVLAGYHSWKDVRNGSAALRAAADQLDAVQEAWDKGYRAGKYDQLGWDGVYDTDNPYTPFDAAPQGIS